jgi:mutator protein MutT
MKWLSELPARFLSRVLLYSTHHLELLLTKPVIDVAIAIIIEQDRVLITRRKKDTHLANLWEFPGGKRLPSESWGECLLREVREELGVTIKISRSFERIEHKYSDRKVILQSYLCRISEGKPRPLASQELKWVDPAKILSYSFPEANLPILKKLIEGVSFD